MSSVAKGSGAPVRWEELSWEQVAAMRDSGIDLAILPVGATEQHGLHLPMGVDTMSAVAIADGVSARTGFPVLPAIPVGCSLGHSKHWPGLNAKLDITIMANAPSLFRMSQARSIHMA